MFWVQFEGTVHSREVMWWQEHEAAGHTYIVKKKSKVWMYCLKAGGGESQMDAGGRLHFLPIEVKIPTLGMVLPTFRVGLPYSLNPTCKCPHRRTKGVFHPDSKTDYFVKIFSFYVVCTHTNTCMVMHKNLDSTYETKCIFPVFPFFVVFLT